MDKLQKAIEWYEQQRDSGNFTGINHTLTFKKAMCNAYIAGMESKDKKE